MTRAVLPCAWHSGASLALELQAVRLLPFSGVCAVDLQPVAGRSAPLRYRQPRPPPAIVYDPSLLPILETAETGSDGVSAIERGVRSYQFDHCQFAVVGPQFIDVPQPASQL